MVLLHCSKSTQAGAGSCKAGCLVKIRGWTRCTAMLVWVVLKNTGLCGRLSESEAHPPKPYRVRPWRLRA